MDPAKPSPTPRTTITEILVIVVAAIGFLFDTYELLMFPITARPALSELLGQSIKDPALLNEQIGLWIGRILWIAALCGGIFGLLGGYLIDRFGRKTVMIGAILVYSFSPVAAAFSTSLGMLIVFRCLTFVGVCVEFVAAITWLAELFPDKRRRELVIGWTQAFASLGGIVVTVVFQQLTAAKDTLPVLPLPEGFNGQAPWRYTLLTGLVPGILILFLMPFVPESKVWRARRDTGGAMSRPSFGQLFSPQLRRVTIVTTILSACAYAAAFGALQLTPAQIVPGLPAFGEQRAELTKTKAKLEGEVETAAKGSPEGKSASEGLKNANKELVLLKKTTEEKGASVQLYQELGGLTGRILLAILVVYVASKRRLLRIFQIPGLIVFPLTYLFLFQDRPDLFAWGIFVFGLMTVAQFSYFGEYLPKVFPVHLRGTGASFATNVGGRMIGTFAAFVTTAVVAPMMSNPNPFIKTAHAAAIVAGSAFLISLIAGFFLPEPKEDVPMV